VPQTKSTFERYDPYKLLKERFSDGSTLEDIFKVILLKEKEWKGSEMYRYMIPATLFRKSNFEKYFQQLQISTNHKTNSNGNSTNKQGIYDFIAKATDFEL
jgi:uncharacterized phage protein (TIGR02220 family)